MKRSIELPVNDTPSAKKAKTISKIEEAFTVPASCSSEQDYQRFFDTLAHFMFHEMILSLNHSQNLCRVAEVEFYVAHKDVHYDPFCHRSPEELLPAQWYFHRAGKNNDAGYKGGSYKGADITFGKHQVFAGSLIRAVVTEGGDYLEGPSRCVDYFLEKINVPSLNDLVFDKFNKELHVEKNPYLTVKHKSEFDESRLQTMFQVNKGVTSRQGARVGLSLKKLKTANDNQLHTHFMMRPYRYCLLPHRVKKNKWSLACQLFAANLSVDVVSTELKLAKKVCEGYMKSFTKGRTTDDKQKQIVKFFGKKLSTAEHCELAGILL